MRDIIKKLRQEISNEIQEIIKIVKKKINNYKRRIKSKEKVDIIKRVEFKDRVKERVQYFLEEIIGIKVEMKKIKEI